MSKYVFSQILFSRPCKAYCIWMVISLIYLLTVSITVYAVALMAFVSRPTSHVKVNEFTMIGHRCLGLGLIAHICPGLGLIAHICPGKFEVSQVRKFQVDFARLMKGSQVLLVTSPTGHKSKELSVRSVTSSRISCKIYKIN